MTTAYRYNAKNRGDRKFNNTGLEKNPNKISFYATNLKYADRYKTIWTENGYEAYTCELETKEVDCSNLFDMNENYSSLETYNNYADSQIARQLKDYTELKENSKTKRDVALWTRAIEELKGRKEEITRLMIRMEFQQLSDFDNQNDLVKELKSLGYNGYKTTNEVAIF